MGQLTNVRGGLMSIRQKGSDLVTKINAAHGDLLAKEREFSDKEKVSDGLVQPGDLFKLLPTCHVPADPP